MDAAERTNVDFTNRERDPSFWEKQIQAARLDERRKVLEEEVMDSQRSFDEAVAVLRRRPWKKIRYGSCPKCFEKKKVFEKHFVDGFDTAYYEKLCKKCGHHSAGYDLG